MRAVVGSQPHAGAVRHVRRAFAFKVWQQDEPIATRAHFRRRLFVLRVRHTIMTAHQFRGDCDVHCTQEWQPAICGITERGDFAFRVNHRLGCAGIDGATGAKAGGDNARARVARADGAHHVVAAAGTHQYVGGQSQCLSRARSQCARRLIAGDQRRQLVRQRAVNGFHGWRGPFALLHIQ